MRITAFLVGCVQSSGVVLKPLRAGPDIVFSGMLTPQASKFNPDFVDIAGIATDAGVPVHCAEGTGAQALVVLLRDYWVEIVFAIGWSRILGAGIFEIPRHGVVGFHPLALRQNRGRYPLIWALALGLEQTASTLFAMDEGADSRPNLGHDAVPTTPHDDAQSLYDKVLVLPPRQANDITDHLVTGDLGACPQDHTRATPWRKHGALVGLTDWRMSAEAVRNLTRALTRPRFVATFRHGDRLFKLWRCEVVTDSVPRSAEPGKVLHVDARGPVIKTSIICRMIVTGISEEQGFTAERVESHADEIDRVSEAYGFAEAIWLDFPTATLDAIPMSELVGAITHAAQRVEPTDIYLPHRRDAHTDHASVFAAAISVSKWFHYGSVEQVFAYETPSEAVCDLSPDALVFRPTVFVDISDTIDRKIEIAAISESQFAEYSFPRSFQGIGALTTLRGAASGLIAEDFMLLRQRIVKESAR